MPREKKSAPSVIITGGGRSFAVGHLSMANIAELRRQHVVRLLETIDAYKDLFTEDGEFQRSYGAVSVILEMADAIAHLISLSTDDITQVEAASLPVGVQLRALIEIIKLSAGQEAFGGLAPQFTDFLSRIDVRPQDVN